MKARVLWEIDVEVEGNNVEACAQDALNAITQEGSEATVFVVFPEGGQPQQVDLTLGTVEDFTPVCELALTEVDEAGTPFGTAPHQLKLASVEDIVSHARQLAVLTRQRQIQDEEVSACLAELNDALAAAGL